VKSAVAFLVLVVVSGAGSALCNQSASGHKSEAEIARMTPGQRVREYCSEYSQHGLWDRDYLNLLDGYITRDGLKAVPALVEVINEFDPTKNRGGGKDKDAASSEAEILLGSLDTGCFRLRAYEEGRVAIDAVRRVTKRMQAAHYETTPDEGEHTKRLRYEITIGILRDLEGNNNYDRAIQDTLELKHKIKLSDKELLSFSDYLISQDPHYLGWSEPDWYVDHNKLNEAGNPAQYRIVKNIERFQEAYLEYKKKSAR
jgi:hypothetical protein